MKVEKEWLSEQIDKGRTLTDIGIEINMSVQSVQNFVTNYNLSSNNQKKGIDTYKNPDWLRKKLKLYSKYKLAKMLNVRVNTISYWEQKHKICVTRAKRKTYGIPVKKIESDKTKTGVCLNINKNYYLLFTKIRKKLDVKKNKCFELIIENALKQKKLKFPEKIETSNHILHFHLEEKYNKTWEKFKEKYPLKKQNHLFITGLLLAEKKYLK